MIDLGIHGKSAYITGGAQGVGLAVAQALTQAGVRVAISDLSETALAAARATLPEGTHTVLADLSKADEVQRANTDVQSWAHGSPDFLINNVGRGSSNDFASATDEDWFQSFQLNLMSHVRTTRFFLQAMSKEGAIVTVASDLAKQPEAVPVEYGAMKAALLHVTKNLALHHAPLRINAVLPGPVWTPLWTRPGGLVDELAAKYQLGREAALDRCLEDRQLPLGIADPSDVADLIAFLVSPLAKRITGAAIDLGGTVRGLL